MPWIRRISHKTWGFEATFKRKLLIQYVILRSTSTQIDLSSLQDPRECEQTISRHETIYAALQCPHFFYSGTVLDEVVTFVIKGLSFIDKEICRALASQLEGQSLERNTICVRNIPGDYFSINRTFCIPGPLMLMIITSTLLLHLINIFCLQDVTDEPV